MTRRIDTDAVNYGVRLQDQAGDPASPAAGYKVIYTKSGGLYLINSSGTVIGPIKTVATDTVWDAAGDLVYATGADAAQKLVIGTANQILRVNSGATAPEWASVGRVLISSSTPTGTGTLSLTSIPAGYNSLEVEIIARSTQAATNVDLYQQLNGDSTAGNYRYSLVEGHGTSTTGAAGGDSYTFGGIISGASSPAGSCGAVKIKIINYASTVFNKQTIYTFTSRRDATTVYQLSGTGGQEWENAAAINRIDYILSAGNYDTGSTIRLYGVY